jgi:hypothetical protein
LEAAINEDVRWLDVPAAGHHARLFTAQVDRLRLTYSFTPGIFARAIAQYEETTRNIALYLQPVAAKDATLTGSILLAFKLNWQSVAFLGLSEERTWVEATRTLAPSNRQGFVKFSYAFQN